MKNIDLLQYTDYSVEKLRKIFILWKFQKQKIFTTFWNTS